MYFYTLSSTNFLISYLPTSLPIITQAKGPTPLPSCVGKEISHSIRVPSFLYSQLHNYQQQQQQKWTISEGSRDQSKGKKAN